MDTETGGLTPGHHSLLQVGLAAYDGQCVTDTLQLNISQSQYTVTPRALEINGLNLLKLQQTGVTPGKAVSYILGFILGNFKDKPILAGHNVCFDKYMLRHFLASQDVDMDSYISHRMLDTMSLLHALAMIDRIPVKVCSSSQAFKYFDCEPEIAHDALNDCLATVKLFEKLMYIMQQPLDGAE